MHSKCAYRRLKPTRALSPTLGYLAIIRGPAMPLLHHVSDFSEGQGPKKPTNVEQIDRIQMPGFITPENRNEEGYFTQKSGKELEELKKKLDKPKVDAPDRKE